MEDVELENDHLKIKFNNRVDLKEVLEIGYTLKLGFKAKGISLEEA